MNLAILGNNVRWRVFERETLEDTFGEFSVIKAGDLESTAHFVDSEIVYWLPNSDEVDSNLLQKIYYQRDMLDKSRHFNDARFYMNYHDKASTFNIWNKEGVPTPRYCEFKSLEDLREKREFDFPFLIRLNNNVNGKDSYLVFNEDQLIQDFKLLESKFKQTIDKKSYTKMIAVELIDTTKENRYNHSYRIISTDKKVITGYARICEKPDISKYNRGPNGSWSAFTGKFKNHMSEDFIKYQRRVQKIIEKNENLITKAVSSLGMSVQGLDVVEDQEGSLFFLESQPGFSTGYHNSPKPFYNPNQSNLVNFILENQSRFENECPLYYKTWLNKKNLFKQVFKNLKES